jgi:hypothetical protein
VIVTIDGKAIFPWAKYDLGARFESKELPSKAYRVISCPQKHNMQLGIMFDSIPTT